MQGGDKETDAKCRRACVEIDFVEISDSRYYSNCWVEDAALKDNGAAEQ